MSNTHDVTVRGLSALFSSEEPVNTNLLVAVAASGTQYTDKLDMGNHAFGSIQVFWTGTVSGSWSFWGSNKSAPNESNDTDWTQLTLGRDISQPAGTAGNDGVDLNELGMKWARGKHVKASGAGNVEAWGQAKD